MAFASEDLTFGQMNAVIKKLGGAHGAMRFLRDELSVSDAVSSAVAVWKTIPLGIFSDMKSLKTSRGFTRCIVGGYAETLLDNLTLALASKPIAVDLVIRTVEELGFKSGAYYWQICARAIELGLELCPVEVGPMLRLVYCDQPREGPLCIASEAIIGSSNDRNIFTVRHGAGGLWLDWYDVGTNDVFATTRRFVFVLPRK